MSDFVQNLFDAIAAKNLEKEKNLNKKNNTGLLPKGKQVDSINPSELFMTARDFAGQHIQQYINSSHDYNWLKMEYTHPCFDHFNFKYKNQIFSVLIDIRNKDGKSLLPPEFTKRQIGAAQRNNLVPCIFPVMINDLETPSLNAIKVIGDGINLFNTVTKDVVIPEQIGTDEKILMSPWELHNFAIMYVRTVLKQKNVQVISFQDIPVINPQIWFLDDRGNKCWIVVRYSTYSKEPSIAPDEIAEVARSCFKFNGYFCGLNFSPSKKSEEKYLYRNIEIGIKFNGFRPIHTYN